MYNGAGFAASLHWRSHAASGARHRGSAQRQVRYAHGAAWLAAQPVLELGRVEVVRARQREYVLVARKVLEADGTRVLVLETQLLEHLGRGATLRQGRDRRIDLLGLLVVHDRRAVVVQRQQHLVV